jgi:hypothetical protein
MRTAQCCCGALAVNVSAEPDSVALCHCVECQRRTGSAFGVAAFFAAAAVHVSGESSTYERISEAGQKLVFRFCPNCGSTVYWETERHPGKIAVALGSFADPEFPRPSRSVFERARHRWVGLPRDIPAHIAGRDSAPVARDPAI